MNRIWNWLVRDWQWPSAALFAAAFLFAILPLLAVSSGSALALIFVQLPIYMSHQAEEHLGDRFRQYTNRRIGGGLELLTPAATFWINSLGVWLFDLIALYLAWALAPSAGLAAAYLALVNGVGHIVQGATLREYNPGLVTSIALFLPAGLWCVWTVGLEDGIGPHFAGLAAAVAVHAMIIAHVARRRRSLIQAA